MVNFHPGVKTIKLDGNGIKKTTTTFQKGDIVHNKPSLWNIVEEYDYNGDGKVDEMLIQEYYDNKQLKSSERRHFEYDANGRTTYESYDHGDDGSIELDVTFEYDSKGRLIKRTEGRTDGKKTISIQYTNGGRIVSYDTDGGGSPDLIIEDYGSETGDHQNADGYSQSTDSNVYKHPKSFGL